MTQPAKQLDFSNAGPLYIHQIYRIQAAELPLPLQAVRYLRAGGTDRPIFSRNDACRATKLGRRQVRASPLAFPTSEDPRVRRRANIV